MSEKKFVPICKHFFFDDEYIWHFNNNLHFQEEAVENSERLNNKIVFVLSGIALKWSFRGRGCSRFYVQSTAARFRGKPAATPLKGQEGKYNPSSAHHFPKFYKRQKEDTVNSHVTAVSKLSGNTLLTVYRRDESTFVDFQGCLHHLHTT